MSQPMQVTTSTGAPLLECPRCLFTSDIAKIGRATEEVMAINIDRVRDQMRAVGATSRVKGPITLDQVYDFSFVKKAYEEIRVSKWDPMRYEYVRR